MSTDQGGGSILYKIIIGLLVVLMIGVILIPGEIWTKEDEIMKKSRSNMSSLYEAQRYFFKLKGRYTNDKDELITTVSDDSALLLNKRIVEHTDRLKKAMEAYFNTPIIKNLLLISQNIHNTEEDFNNNERFFNKYEEIRNEAEALLLRLATFRSSINYENYHLASLALDSLWQLRRDITDYSLQNAARSAKLLSLDIANKLQGIDFKMMGSVWEPLSKDITKFLNKVNSTDLKLLTSVADRVADFQTAVSDGFSNIENNVGNASIDEAIQAAEEINAVYRAFLTDFLTTEKFAQHQLSETDSMLLNLNQDNFFDPVNKKEYIFTFQDTLGLIVEDPTLLSELQDLTLQEVENINNLSILQAFDNYSEKIDSLVSYYLQVKKAYRRNTEVFIKTKELDESIKKLKESLAFDAYLNLKSFVINVPQSNSFSAIKEQVNTSLVSCGTFRQIYGDNFFGNLDSAHVNIINNLNDFNEILSTVRRNTFTFDSSIEELNLALKQIKSISAKDVLASLNEIELNLQKIFLFASEGREKTVYAIFSTHIINQGKVYGKIGRASWEDN